MTEPATAINKPEYVIDTNVFLNFWKLDDSEPFNKDVHVSAWNYLEAQIESGRIIAPNKVQEELLRHGSEELLRWVEEHSNMFVPLIDVDVEPLKRVVDLHKAYRKLRSSEADAIVVAMAKGRNLLVITSEQRQEDGQRSKTNPKIPNVCDDLGVDCYSVNAFFRKEKQSF